MNQLAFMDKYISELEQIDCPVCKRFDVTPLGSLGRGNIAIDSVICNCCALIYLNPKPSAHKYYQFYASGDYRRFLNTVKKVKSAMGVENYFSDEKFMQRKEAGKQIAREYFKDILTKDDLYFDFGCDFGGILAGVKEELGSRIMGNEPSKLCAAYIKDKLGISIIDCSMEDISSTDKEKYKGAIKLASIMGVLEHVNNPVTCLNTAYAMLAEGGYLYIETADFIKRMETDIEGVDNFVTIDHQYYFHEDVFKYMLKQCGFKVVRLEHNPLRPRMIHILAKKDAIFPCEIKYDAGKIAEKVLTLNQRARHYRKSIIFRLKNKKDNALLMARKFFRRAVRNLV